jgi:hypothetical protein
MKEPPLVRQPLLLKTTRNLMATPNHFWATIRFNHNINAARLFHLVEGL